MQHGAWWRCVESGGVLSPPLPGAGAPAKATVPKEVLCGARPCGTVALLTQSYPADFEATLLQLGLATSTSRSFGGRSPRWRRTVGRRAPRVRDDSGRSPRARRTVARRARSAKSFFESPRAPHRMQEGAISLLSQRALLARARHRSCRPWSSTRFHNKSICASSWSCFDQR